MVKTLVVVAAVVVALAAPTLAADPSGGYNFFQSKCQFDLTRMRAQVDPIVSHGVKPSAHMHDFYAFIRPSENTIANSTLPAGTTTNPGYTPVVTTCPTYGDWPSYWFPTAKINGAFSPSVTDPGARTVAASSLLATYRAPVGHTVLPTPYGMTFVAGNGHATSFSEQSAHVRWSCGGVEPSYRRPVDCTGVGVVTAVLEFPNCWNQQHGWGTTGWDEKSPPQFDGAAGIDPANFAYSAGGLCPDGFAEMAQLVTRQRFALPSNAPLVDPYNEDGSSALSFSSGPFYTYHGDYLNLWSRFEQTLTRKCLNLEPVVTVDCVTGLGASAADVG